VKIIELFTEAGGAKRNTFAPWHPRIPTETDEIMGIYGNARNGIKILRDGSVSVRGESYYTIKEVGPVDGGKIGILVKYNNIGTSSRTYIKDSPTYKLTTLEYGPNKIGSTGSLSIQLSEITSFNGFQCEVSEALLLQNCPSLKEWGQGCQITCHRVIIDYAFDYDLFRTIGQHFKIRSHITLYPDAAKTLVGKGLLSLFKVKKPIGSGSFGIQLYYSDKSIIDTALVQATAIVNKYLASHTPNLLACQEELIDNGLKDYAEL